ncbi:hypothetical protein C8Q75DRAFT_165019 [Abortiporus biennis]|nr:hypothetical protein C8Q75DRAFT_165019 [Abortiporus biennis]
MHSNHEHRWNRIIVQAAAIVQPYTRCLICHSELRSILFEAPHTLIEDTDWYAHSLFQTEKPQTMVSIQPCRAAICSEYFQEGYNANCPSTFRLSSQFFLCIQSVQCIDIMYKHQS